MRAVRNVATALVMAVLALAATAITGAIAYLVIDGGLAALFSGGDIPGSLAPYAEMHRHALAAASAAFALTVAATELNSREHPKASIVAAVAAIAAWAASYFVFGGDSIAPADSTQMKIALVATLFLAAVMMSSISSMFKANYDTGAEHGDQSLASSKEMKALADRKFFFNNFYYSENTAQSYTAWSDKLKKGQRARNRNEITYGTSGQGKTHNRVMPDLMNAIGYAEAVEPCMSGGRHAPHNLLEHIRYGKRGAGCFAGEMRGSGFSGGKKRKIQKIRKENPEFGEGYDVVHTDPKGENLMDIGHLYERAGYDIKLLDTVSFKGLCYNPLAYIKEHYTDVKPPEMIRCYLAGGSKVAEGASCATCVDKESRFAIATDPRLLDEGMYRIGVGEGSVNFQAFMIARQKIDKASATLSDEDYAALGITAEEWEKAGDSAYLIDSDTAEMRIDDSEGEERVENLATQGRYTVAKLLRSQTYVRTHMTISLKIEAPNNADEVVDAACELEVDRCLALKDNGVTIECEGDVAGASVLFDRFDGERVVEIEALGMQPGAVLYVDIEADVESYRVPDGVQLTKVVECLASNLKSDVSAESRQDPFWEDCKRLALISFAAAAFEWYAPEERNLITCMDLLNMASNEDGDPKGMTPLAYLMRRWEDGQVWQQAASKKSSAPLGRPSAGGSQTAGGWVDSPDFVPHSRTSSMALHAFHAFTSGAPETVQSVIATCQTSFTAMISPDIKKMLSRDELHLETLGDAGQKQALFIVTKDTDSPYDFLTALVVYQAIDVMLDKAYKRYGGSLPRHVRFVLDEAMTIGKIPILTRAIAVVRSRNASISLYMQSKAQAEEVYGEKESKILVDNCTTQCFLGGHDVAVLKEFAETIGNETIYSRITNRSFDGSIGPKQISESIQATGREVRSAAQIRQMDSSKLLVFILGMKVVEDKKYPTERHPYYPYVYTSHKRALDCPVARVTERFDYSDYLARKDAARAEMGGGGNERRAAA